MSLYDKLMGLVDNNVPVHEFMASIAERNRGQVDRAEIMTMFNLEVADLSELDDILDKNDSLAADRQFEFGRMIHDTLLLSSCGMKFTTAEEFYTRISEFA